MWNIFYFQIDPKTILIQWNEKSQKLKKFSQVSKPNPFLYLIETQTFQEKKIISPLVSENLTKIETFHPNKIKLGKISEEMEKCRKESSQTFYSPFVKLLLLKESLLIELSKFTSLGKYKYIVAVLAIAT